MIKLQQLRNHQLPLGHHKRDPTLPIGAEVRRHRGMVGTGICLHRVFVHPWNDTKNEPIFLSQQPVPRKDDRFRNAGLAERPRTLR